MVSLYPIIGLEIHLELKTKSKMFCGCAADYFGRPPNSRVCPVCLGLPGVLPAANKKAVEWTVLAGLAFECQISLESKFDRKNYFYPDLPKGYQISQYDRPLAQKGCFSFETEGAKRTVGLIRIHLEEDTAKMIHVQGATLLDFNRAGVPLLEIVTEPEIRSPQEAKIFLKKIQQAIRYLKISEADLEKGSMRCEANVSLSEKGSRKLPPYKVEIKNLNSFRYVEKALAYEIERQKKILNSGRKPLQETRGWEEKKQKTYPLRWKEEAQDYRYFSEPDLPPIQWQPKEITAIKKNLPEPPLAKKERFRKEYKLNDSQAGLLTKRREEADYFEKAVKLGRKKNLKAQLIANTIINRKKEIKKQSAAGFIEWLAEEKQRPVLAVTDLAKTVKQVLQKNRQPVNDFLQGKTEAIEFLLGLVMKASQGKAEPSQARKMILDELKQKG